MADFLTPRERSERMARIRGRDTKPELAVRAILRGLGARARLHRRDLPGSPDLVLVRERIAILVHGCFWHRHQGCARATHPATRRRFWREKFARNVARDRRVARLLRRLGFRVIVIWECRLRDPERVRRRLAREIAARTTPPRRASRQAGARHLSREEPRDERERSRRERGSRRG